MKFIPIPNTNPILQSLTLMHGYSGPSYGGPNPVWQAEPNNFFQRNDSPPTVGTPFTRAWVRNPTPRSGVIRIAHLSWQ